MLLSASPYHRDPCRLWRADVLHAASLPARALHGTADRGGQSGVCVGDHEPDSDDVVGANGAVDVDREAFAVVLRGSSWVLVRSRRWGR